MRVIKRIIIHCAYTLPNRNHTTEDIRRWHVHDNKWRDIGYHYVIERSGEVIKGRAEDTSGAHVAGHNVDSLGVCLLGGKPAPNQNPCNFTQAQWRSLESHLDELQTKYNIPNNMVSGHNEWSSKTCPTFDVRAYMGG